MANDIISAAWRGAACPKIRGTLALQQGNFELFPSAGPLEMVTMDILGPFPKSSHEHRLILVIKDNFSKMTCIIPLRSTTATDIAMALLVHWIYLHGLPLYLLTDNEPQFVANLFD